MVDPSGVPTIHGETHIENFLQPQAKLAEPQSHRVQNEIKQRSKEEGPRGPLLFVELPGIEPGSSGAESGLLRVQTA